MSDADSPTVGHCVGVVVVENPALGAVALVSELDPLPPPTKKRRGQPRQKFMVPMEVEIQKEAQFSRLRWQVIQLVVSALKRGVLYLVGAIFLGFWFILAQLVESWAWVPSLSLQSSSPRLHQWWWWWWEADLHELLFFLAIISAVAHAISKTMSQGRYRYWAASMALGWFVVIVLTQAAPGVYLHNENEIVTAAIDRGGCHPLQSLNKQFEVSRACFLDKDKRPVPTRMMTKSFLRFDINGSVPSPSKFSSIIEVGSKLREYVHSGIIKMYQDILITQKQDTEFLVENEYVSLLDEDCFSKMLDIYCVDVVKKCETSRCEPPSIRCHSNELMDSVQSLLHCVANGCRKKLNGTLNCSSVSSNPDKVAVSLLKLYLNLMTRIESFSPENFIKSSRGIVDHAVYLIREYGRRSLRHVSPLPPKSSVNGSVGCAQWKVNFSSSADTNSPVITSHFMNTSCDARITTFTQSSRKSESWNSKTMFAIFFAYCTVSVMVLGESSTALPPLTASVIRVCGFAIGLFMAALIYIGSVHILRDILNNGDPISKDVQRKWRLLYLFVSYGCVHWSILLLLPSIAATSINNAEDSNEIQREKKIIRDRCSSTVNTTISRCCGKATSHSLYKRLHAFVATFWLAGGELFWLKLVILEILEIGLQLKSITATAASSHVTEISMSVFVLSANLVVLPLLIRLSRRLFPSLEMFGICAVILLVEIVFDKIYVCIAVLLRYNTLIQRDMKVVDQLIVHGALLVPAVMTALDLQDALTLATQYVASRDDVVLKNLGKTEPVHETDSASHGITLKQENSMKQFSAFVEKRPCILKMFSAGLAIALISGLSLGLYVGFAVHAVHIDCNDRIGKIASCAQQKFYFSSGLFGETSCAFERVESFVCADGYQLDPSVVSLPNAVGEYQKMHKLTFINLSGSSLEMTPAGWSKIPAFDSNGFSIDLSNSLSLTDIEFSLCAFATPLKSINLKGTPVSMHLNWTAALNGSQFLRKALNPTCWRGSQPC